MKKQYLNKIKYTILFLFAGIVMLNIAYSVYSAVKAEKKCIEYTDNSESKDDADSKEEKTAKEPIDIKMMGLDCRDIVFYFTQTAYSPANSSVSIKDGHFSLPVQPPKVA